MKNLIGVIKTYEDACKELNTPPVTIEHFAFLAEDERDYAFSMHKLLTVHKAFHQGRTFDWNDYDQPKYYPWWDMETYEGQETGSGFRLIDVYFSCVFTLVGSRLCSFSEEEARYIAETFIDEYRKMLK